MVWFRKKSGLCNILNYVELQIAAEQEEIIWGISSVGCKDVLLQCSSMLVAK